MPLARLVDKLRFTRVVKPKWGLAVHRAIRAIDRRDFIKIIKAAGKLINNLALRTEFIIRKAEESIQRDRK